MSTAYIYRIRSLIHPERFYIGSTVNYGRRFYQHSYLLENGTHFNKKLQCHYNKYGLSDLGWSLLYIFEYDVIDDIFKTEQYFLDKYNPYFNILKIAGVSPFLEMKDEIRKIPKQHKNQIAWNKGLRGIYTEEQRKNMSESMRAYYKTPEGRERMRERSESMKGGKRMLGHRHTPETKEKLREINLGRKHKDETREKMCGHTPWNKGLTGDANPITGRKQSSETINKRRETRRKNSDRYSQDGKRKCSKCNRYLDLECFSPDKRLMDGLSCYCKECTRENRREYEIRSKRPKESKDGKENKDNGNRE